MNPTSTSNWGEKLIKGGLDVVKAEILQVLPIHKTHAKR
jgi:hypothetical protein